MEPTPAPWQSDHLTRRREHWQLLADGYSAGWEPPAKRRLNARELEFVGRHLDPSAREALDIGVGNGRILAEILRRAPTCTVRGVDLAPAMVDVCRQRFAGEPRIADLQVCDVATEPLPFERSFDFISAIRVLKYSANWREVIQRLADALVVDGVFVFTMPNRNSLNRLSRAYAVEWHTASVSQIEHLCGEVGLTPIEMTGFVKLPYALYNAPKRRSTARAVVALDRALARHLGDATIAREIFVAARKP